MTKRCGFIDENRGECKYLTKRGNCIKKCVTAVVEKNDGTVVVDTCTGDGIWTKRLDEEIEADRVASEIKGEE